jgi:type I restriction enzyme S subunit
MATNQGFKSFIPNHEFLDSKYLFHWLRANRKHLESLGNGATFKEVSKAVVSRLSLPLPPLPEQRRIAAILDAADALRQKRRQALALLDQLSQSIFIEMFGDPAKNRLGWDNAPLSELVREDDTINYGVVQPGEDVEDGIPFIRVGDLLGGRISVEKLKRISPAIEAQYKRSRLRGDEILVSCVGSIGTVALASPEVAGYNIARAVARISLADKLNRMFVAAYLRTEHVQKYFTKELRTVSQPTLNIKQIAETCVLLPPLKLQEEFASRVCSVNELGSSSDYAKGRTDFLFSSLQHRAFRGEL